eukprot:TRINITY_DN14748_c0_g1_i2.p1 TRINITY_DN14748_c0_g1~~TRINITY_DN14748_c0_g1_i2.p1  ORF type:complete len:446 (+),score=69.43 TRINITY_DN14748_c0_g1_i2:77-1339(+)
MAAAAGEGRGTAAEDAARPRAWSWNGARLYALPVLTACPGVRSCSVGWDHTAVVCGRQRAVRSHGANASGQLGAGDTKAHKTYIPTDPPLHWAASVQCGMKHTVLLRPNGEVCSWGHSSVLGRDGDPPAPAKVLGLPPVAAVFPGLGCTIVLTRDDGAYAFGDNALSLPPDTDPGGPVRIAALSGRRLRRIAFAPLLGVAEAGQQLLWWAFGNQTARTLNVQLPAPLRCGDEVAFPLRSLAAGIEPASASAPDPKLVHAVAADAQGALWFCTADVASRACSPPRRAALGAERVVKVVAAGGTSFFVTASRTLRIRRTCIVALTEAGELWDVSDPAACRSISARLPPRQGLVPCGGVVARRVVLVPDHCGGRRRLTLFARLSIRLEIPGDPVREVLAPLVVHGDYITGPSSDPFGPPVDSG